MFEDLRLTIHWTESKELRDKLNLQDENQVFVGEDAYIAFATLNYMDKKIFNDNLFEYRGYSKTKISLDYKQTPLITGYRIDLSDLEFKNEKSPFTCMLEDAEEDLPLIEALLAEEKEYLKTHNMSVINDYKAWVYQYEMDKQSFEEYKAHTKYPKTEIMDWKEDESSGNIIFTSLYNSLDFKEFVKDGGLPFPFKIRYPEGLPVEAALEKINRVKINDSLRDGRGCWCRRIDDAKGMQAFRELSFIHDKFLDWAKQINSNIQDALEKDPEKIVSLSINNFIAAKVTIRLGTDQGYTTQQYLGEGLHGTCLFSEEELLALAWYMSATHRWDHPELPLRRQTVINPQLIEQTSEELLAFMQTPSYQEYYKRTQIVMEDARTNKKTGIYSAFLKNRHTERISQEIERAVSTISFRELNREEYIFQVKGSTGETVRFNPIPKDELVKDTLIYIQLLNHGYAKNKIGKVFMEHAPLASFFEDYDEIVSKTATALIEKFPELYQRKNNQEFKQR